MKIKINSSDLSKTLLPLMRVISPNAITPIAEYFKFSLNGGIMQVVATNFESTILTSVSDIIHDEDGVFLIDAKRLFDLTKSLASQPIDIEVIDFVEEGGKSITITSSSGQYTFISESSTDFPDQISNQTFDCTIDAGLLYAGLERVMFASESKFLQSYCNRTYIYKEEKGENLVCVGTNGFTLSESKFFIGYELDGFDMVLENRNAKTLSSLLVGCDKLWIKLVGNQLYAKIDNLIYSCLVVDYKYIDYNNFIKPKEFSVTLDRMELLVILKRIKQLSEIDDTIIKFEMGDSTVLTAKSVINGELIKETIMVDGFIEESVFSLIAEQAIKSLNSFETEKVALEYDQSKSIHFRGIDSDDTHYVFIMKTNV